VLDLLACLDHLVRLGVTRPGAIAAHAASAGCLTLAAAINARPEWFAAAVLEAPFVDLVAGTGAVTESEQRLDDSQLLTEHEGDEWGHPWQQPTAAELISSLCPYTTLPPAAAAAYPALLVTAGLQDNRVPFWMPLKFVAKLRSMQQQQQQQQDSAGLGPVLLQFDEAAGHFSMGVSGCSLEDIAGQQAFLLHSTPRPDV
jgi:oligopeptidase B